MIAPDDSQPTSNKLNELFVPPLQSLAQRYSRWGWAWSWMGVELLGNLIVMGGIMGLLLGKQDQWNLSVWGIIGATIVFTIAAMPQYAIIKRFLQRPARSAWYGAICCGYWLVVGFWWLRSHEYLTPFHPEITDIIGVSMIMTVLHSLPPTLALTICLPRPWLWLVAHLGAAASVVGVTSAWYLLISSKSSLGVYIVGVMFAYPLITALLFYEGMRRTFATKG